LITHETSEPLRRWSVDYSNGNGATNTSKRSTKSENKREGLGPVFPVPECDAKREGDKIWGLTAFVLRPLLRNVFGPVLFGFGEEGEREEEYGGIVSSKL